MAQAALPGTRAELDDLVRRIVREELMGLVRSRRGGLDDARHEGPEDTAGDDALLAEALAVLQAYEAEQDAWLDWDELKGELSRAEAAGELPD